MLNSDEFDDIDELLSGKYISLGPNEKKILKFFGPTERKIEEVEKKWNNEPVTKIRFVVIDPNNNMEKWFDVGKRSARLIVSKLKEGHRLMRVERSGTGKETLYIPTPVSSNTAAG